MDVIGFAVGIGTDVVVDVAVKMGVAGAVEAELGWGDGFGKFAEDGPFLVLGGVEVGVCELEDGDLWFVRGDIGLSSG